MSKDHDNNNYIGIHCAFYKQLLNHKKCHKSGKSSKAEVLFLDKMLELRYCSKIDIRQEMYLAAAADWTGLGQHKLRTQSKTQQ